MNSTIRGNVNTHIRSRQFTNEDDEAIRDYFNTPVENRISLTEFARTINHSSRSIKQRYNFYLRPKLIFTEDIDQLLIDSVEQYRNGRFVPWREISINEFGDEYLILILKNRYRYLKNHRRNNNDNDPFDLSSSNY